MLHLIGRRTPLFQLDLEKYDEVLEPMVREGRFLVIGGAGSIGQAVSREIFRRNPQALHVVDISENNLVELVRDLRSTLGYIEGDFRTFAIDCGSVEFDALVTASKGYDFIFNLSALKHVRSEKDPYTLMRMIRVNILNALSTIRWARSLEARKYFCVSTDKAANPANMMGASKRIMEMLLMRETQLVPLSMARFANVAFSDGSLLHGFRQRIAKRQPLSAPLDVRRYFITPEESGQLCLLSGLLGKNREIFFPKLSEELNLTTFSDIAERFLEGLGYEPFLCESEDQARDQAEELINNDRWPCYFFESDTTGEKDFEEFFTDQEDIDLARFEGIGVIQNRPVGNDAALDEFLDSIARLRAAGTWERKDLVRLFHEAIPGFAHKETGKFLDSRM